MKIANSVLDLIGNTPMIKLNKIPKDIDSVILAKCEFLNPSGSVKDRIAKAMLEDAEEKGLLKKESIIVEPTSGNTGISFAMVGAVKGHKVKIVMPEHMSAERQKMIKAFGKDFILTPEEKDVEGAVLKAEELEKENSRVLVLQQFKNQANVRAHFETTAREIWEQTEGKLDAFVAGVGTGGTLMGVAKFMKKKKKGIKIVAVEPEESAVLSGGKHGKHKIHGIGDGFIPDIVDLNLIDEVVTVSTDEAIAMAKKLAREEGLLVGISSGANVHACIKLANKTREKVIVTVLPDRGERYLSTELFNPY